MPPPRRLILWLLALAATLVFSFGARAFVPADDSAAPANDPVPPVATPTAPEPAPLASTPPSRGRIRFTTTVDGVLPVTGRSTVGGVPLPSGHRDGPFWETDGPVPNPTDLAARLAMAFPRTGLWPVIWWDNDDRPQDDMYDSGDLRHAARIDLLRAYNAANGKYGGTRVLKRLAPGGAGVGHGPASAQPFAPLAASWTAFPPDGPPTEGWPLILIPVHRPADILSVLPIDMTEYFTPDQMTAVLRSWQDRYGAVPTVLGAGILELSVDSRPETAAGRRLLQAEVDSFAPDNDAPPHMLRNDVWDLGWPD